MPNGGGEPVKAPLKDDIMPLETLLICIAPVAERVGPPMPTAAETSESTRWSSPVAVARKSGEPNVMWLLDAKVLPLANTDD